eukprot:TRINITY_DN8179_c0_g1_i1.p1 TRINITY_DN8179_c0_g1~~TRINITY_DN8179_c0_g1_i1.p1  ORF type:complete len:959 (+),score=261.96 TRINITY_DN8179_c0_g1_i1:33-2909(+)
MLKSYLEYELNHTFGAITSHPSNIVFDSTGKCAFTGALEYVNQWNLRQGVVTSSFSEETSKKGAKVSVLRLSPDNSRLAVGYSSGAIIIWNVETGEMETKFSGHKSEITALNYAESGTYLASGSKDTDIVVWDMIAERGLYKLRGHKNAITQVAFLNKTKVLVSSSKDQLLKVWDLDTRHCIQTVVGHPSEIWGFAINPEETRVITVCGDNQIRVYHALQPNEIKELEDSMKLESEKIFDNAKLTTDGIEETVSEFDKVDPFKRLSFYGFLKRVTTERIVNIKFTQDGTLFGVQSAGKVIEFFSVHSEEEITKKQKRRMKREREKARVAAEESGEAVVEPTLVPKPSDEYSSKQVLRTQTKILSFDFIPAKRGKEVVVSFYDNFIQLYRRKRKAMVELSSVNLPGHRHDIRSLAMSSHDEMLMSTSSSELKIWNLSTFNCIRTIEAGYGLCGAFVPGDKHTVIGTKNGEVQLYDLNSASLAYENTEVHSQSIFALELTPDRTGFVTGSADKILAFWEFELVTTDVEGAGKQKRLQFSCKKTIEMTEGVFCVKFSPDGKFIAVGLMDYTVRIYFADSMKFYLSLYGHKLPVMCMDISYDGTIIVTGSADKNIRIWGMDFGDCHKSLYAHDDTVMQAAFVPDTHYFFTVGKDGLVKYWDADKHAHIMTLEGHLGEVWAMALSREGNFLVTAGHDREIRQWRQTDRQLFLEEQREIEMEDQWDKALENDLDPRIDEKAESGPATQRNLESVKDAERIMDALELLEEEKEKWIEYERELADAHRRLSKEEIAEIEASGDFLVEKPKPSPLMMDMSGTDYLIWVIQHINQANLESSLLVLPFSQVLILFTHLDTWLKENKDFLLATRILFFLMKVYQVQISANKTMATTINSLREVTRKRLETQKKMIAHNLVALGMIKQQLQVNDDNSEFFEIADKLAKLDSRKHKGDVKTKNWWEDDDETA